MAFQIIRQPDGAYALWSSSIDDFVMIDAEPEHLIRYFLEAEERRIRETVGKIVRQLAAGEHPYHQFTKSWEEALDWYQRRHGEPFDLDQVRREEGAT